MINDEYYVITIPSYNRWDLINKKTLKLLEKCNIDISKIYIFVSDADQYKKYINSLDKKYHENIIIGVKGLLEQRKFISSYFPEGFKILEMDDDIDNITTFKIEDKKKVLVDFLLLDELIISTFKMCVASGYKLWGVYPCDNPYFYKNKTSYDCRFIVGSFFGIINDREIENNIMICEKEDFERTILYHKKYGGVIRYNHIGITTNFYRNKGGLQSEELQIDRNLESRKSIKYLCIKYPNYCKIVNKKILPDIRLILNPDYPEHIILSDEEQLEN